MDKIRKEIIAFNKERDWEKFHTPANLAKSIVLESSELLECFQWSDIDYDKEHVCEELADVMNYCILLAQKLDVDMETIMLEKLELNKCKYPVEKAKGKSTKYNKL